MSQRKIDRRAFLAQSLAATAVVGCGGTPPPRPACVANQDEPVDVDGLSELPAELEACTKRLFEWADEKGWFALLGWAARPQGTKDERLFEKRAFQGTWAADFAGRRAIHPGHPELSALYHVLAHPMVRLPGAEGQDPGRYASIEQLDTLEDFIYALSRWPEVTGCSLAVLAYEYRPARATPLGIHADLVFSRTGIARIGQEEAVYDPVRRRHTNQPKVGRPRGRFAVTPARYALFLVKKAWNDDVPVLGVPERQDADRFFVKPLRKVFSGDPALAGARLVFGEQHRNESLRRLAGYRESFTVRVSPEADPKRPPLFCLSSTIDGREQDEHNSPLVTSNRECRRPHRSGRNGREWVGRSKAGGRLRRRGGRGGYASSRVGRFLEGLPRSWRSWASLLRQDSASMSRVWQC